MSYVPRILLRANLVLAKVYRNHMNTTTTEPEARRLSEMGHEIAQRRIAVFRLGRRWRTAYEARSVFVYDVMDEIVLQHDRILVLLCEREKLEQTIAARRPKPKLPKWRPGQPAFGQRTAARR